MRIDRGEPTCHHGHLLHHQAQLLGVKILQSANHLLCAFVGTEHHIAVFAIDSKRQHITSRAKLRIDALHHHAGARVDVLLLWFLGDVLGIGGVEAKGDKLCGNSLRIFLGVRIQRQPELRIRRGQGQPVHGLRNAVLFASDDGALALHGYIGEDVDNAPLAAHRTLGGRSFDTEALPCSEAEIKGAGIVVVRFHIPHQRHVVGVCLAPSINGGL